MLTNHTTQTSVLFSFRIIDDDIDLKSISHNGEDDALADMLDPDDRPLIADDDELVPKKVVQKVDVFSENKWVKISLCENEDGDFFIDNKNNDRESPSKGLFRKRGGTVNFT